MSGHTHIEQLEWEAIYIIREAVANSQNPVLLYSVGKDSSCLLRLLQKAFAPAPIPIPLLHIDTGYKFPEMIKFRDEMAHSVGAKLVVERNEQAISENTHPAKLGTTACCAKLKTKGLLDALKKHNFDTAIGGAPREEEKSRAKERVFSIRRESGGWDPKSQRPEPWDLYNTYRAHGQSLRVFPLSNWTEKDIWTYIQKEEIPVVPIYFSHPSDLPG